MKTIVWMLFAFWGSLVAESKLHPLFEIENIYPESGPELKVTAMAFEGDDLYLTVCTPNRQSLTPYKKGELVKVSGLKSHDSSQVKSEVLFRQLYQPTAVALLNGSIYVGEKDRIIRLTDQNQDGTFDENEKVVLLEGLADDNFHQFTFGFEKITRSGKTYLVGNFSTAVLLGGKRDLNVSTNPRVKRGTTFMLGPVTGKEMADEVALKYIAGGLRTPNGIGLDDEQNIYVTDNQGIFNPTNKFIRVKPGAFYGHYSIKNEKTSFSAFQPESVDSTNGDSAYQVPPTVHLANLSRSPGNPLFLQGLKGEASAYNGQFLIPEIKGKMLRVFTEEVEGIWQGALFLHSEGVDPEGTKGFTGPPNRIIEGPDQQYYLGHIGAGGGWGVKGRPELQTGLQRMAFKDQFPIDFNEMLAVRNTEDGL